MEFSNTGGMRSPFSPRVRQSITGRKPLGMTARKNQGKFLQSQSSSGDVIYKTPVSTIETYGSPLPVMVTETLTFASGELSVRLSPCGWCWLVAGRRVVAWPRESTSSGLSSPAPAGAPPAARELTLPQTDLAHKADLVELFYEDGAQMPSCVGVSPEGLVRYWWSVGHESASVDVSCDLAGQECDRLVATSEYLLLATTTCSVVLLHPQRHEGRATVTCRVLRPPSGWLGGIGRRVSLLFFGSMPAHADTKLVGVVVLSEGTLDATEEGDREGRVVLVGGGGNTGGGPLIQVWTAGELHEHSLRRPLTEAHARHGDLSGAELIALDVRASGNNGLLLLLAADRRYAIAHISVEDPANPRVTSLVPLRNWPCDVEQPPPRFLPLGPLALLYTPAYLALVSSTVSSDKVDIIDVSAEGDRVLGAELCDGVPLIFSRKHGVLALSTADSLVPTPSVCDSPMGSPCPSDMYDGNLSLYEIDPHEVSSVTTDLCGQLKAAFLFYVRREEAACRSMLQQLPTAALPTNAVTIAADMLDDAPAGDPRWKSRVGGLRTRIPLGSSTALAHAQQLRDKQRALALFRDFLRAQGALHEPGESGKSTAQELCSLAEKLAMAIALRRLQDGSDAQLITAAIQQVVCGDNNEVEEEPEVEEALSSGALSPSDVCYRRVTKITRVIRAIAASAHSHSHHDARSAALHAAAAINIVNNVLGEAHKARAQWSEGPSAGLPRELMPPIVQLVRRALTQSAHNCPDATARWQVVEAAASLADRALSDRSPAPHALRRDLIQPFVDEGLIERAAVLAEKFKDYEMLIEMCINNNDLERLYSYIEKYSNEGVAELSFARIVERGGALVPQLLRCTRPEVAPRLHAWLRAVPGRASLLALHRMAAGDAAAAAPALAQLAATETDSVGRMTTMASLAKLCLLASDEPESQTSDLRRKIESSLSLAEQHTALPRDIRVHNGLDAEDTKVMQPEELIQMYIESESKNLTEYDMKKALDLTDYVRDMEQRDDLRLRVWCSCIRRDDWSSCCVDEPDAALREKMFFRLIELVHIMGGDLELLLPPAEDILTARELAELGSDSRFHFLIKYGYQCMHQAAMVE
ncbi:hypothetical protein evm_000184 [Chilo suppressalis]|nr:hypothetical protein evm_000184 [Chilo suppressalis]